MPLLAVDGEPLFEPSSYSPETNMVMLKISNAAIQNTQIVINRTITRHVMYDLQLKK